MLDEGVCIWISVDRMSSPARLKSAQNMNTDMHMDVVFRRAMGFIPNSQRSHEIYEWKLDFGRSWLHFTG